LVHTHAIIDITIDNTAETNIAIVIVVIIGLEDPL